MGKSHSKKESGTFKTQYIKFLRKKQKNFIQSERQDTSQKAVQFSFVSDTGIEDVDWKIFYEDYLEEHADTCFWATPMLEFFCKEFLPSEKRWIDIMFYEKFKHSLLTPANDELSIDFSSYKQSMLVEKLLVKDPSPRKSLKSPAKSGPDSIVRSLAQAINKSLRKRENPFQVLIKKFKELFLTYYRKKIKELNIASYDESSYRFRPELGSGRAGDSGRAAEIRREAMVNIEYFLKLMTYSVLLFYKPVIGEGKLVYLRELIANSMLNCVVRNDVYNLLFILLRVEHDPEEAILARKIKEMQDINPQNLGINEYLCLNEASPLFKIFQEAVLAESDPAHKHVINSSTFVADQSILVSESALSTRVLKAPYKSAIEWLKSIARASSPLKKLKYVAKMNDAICECVDQFWQGTHINPERLRIDADQYISIMIYIIVKGRVPDLYTHITLAGELASLGAKPRYNAYCLTTFQACFCHLLNMDQSGTSISTKEASPTCIQKKTKKKAVQGNGECSNNKPFTFTPEFAGLQQGKKERRKASQG